MSNKTFHFSMGPVQGFIAESRRTRDLLSSSFLLSYMTGCAMAYVMDHGGNIVFPKVDEDLLILAIRQKGKVQEKPFIGSLPNRFKASVPADFDPGQCEDAVQKAWKKIADAVWELTVAKVYHRGRNTREIWDRQVENWWEMTWVIAEEPNVLDYRKYWRNHIPSDEPGDKCTLIPRLQELSGYVRACEREKQDTFWCQLRKVLDEKYSLDLEEKERLSAIGMIKRFFPYIAKEAIGWAWDDEAIHFPSVKYIAAHPGMMRALEKCPEMAEAYGVKAKKSGIYSVSLGNHFPFLQKKAEANNAKTFISIDAAAFYPNELEVLIEENKVSKDLLDHLNDLIKEMGQPFSRYYALLLMDGDRMGKLLRNRNQTKVSKALSVFCDGLEKHIQDQYEGVTIYAGGDDVMAMFPMNRALGAAVDLSRRYKRSFKEVFHEIIEEATSSAAILFAHYKVPLRDVLNEGHRLLDDVAKANTGRDSLAMGVWTSSGMSVTWSAPWDTIIKEKETNRTVFDEITSSLSSKEGETLLSNSFLYKLQAVYEPMPILETNHKETMKRLITADYIRILRPEKDSEKKAAEEQIEQLLQVCFVAKRKVKGKDIVIEQTDQFKTDGALLAKFLAQERIGEHE